MVRGLQDLGKTIFLTTHYMEEAEYLADRVAIIRKGEIVAEGPPSSLVGADPTTTVRFRLPEDAKDVIAGIEGAREDEGLVSIETVAPTALLYELTRRAQERVVDLPELSVARPSLEDTYLRLVGADEPAEEQPAPTGRRGRRGRR
jgi:ABC-2 type transport system ATP-binding protein